MSQEIKRDFIVIDDDAINNMICYKIIELTIPGSHIMTFTSPETGVDHIRNNHLINDNHDAVVFLDINMPSLTGWDVLEKIESYPEPARKSLKIYMLSSSVDQQDREKADKHPLVLGYITKPLSKAKLQAIFPDN